MTELKMDAVDSQQQKEIEALKQKDVKHDSMLDRIYIFFFLIVLALFVGGVICLPFIAEKPCPHPGCVHHHPE
jgi:hypothetical protein